MVLSRTIMLSIWGPAELCRIARRRESLLRKALANSGSSYGWQGDRDARIARGISKGASVGLTEAGCFLQVVVRIAAVEDL
jgi:hypothetical protein